MEIVTPPLRGRLTHIYLDLIGPPGETKVGHNYVMAIVDSALKFFQAIPLLGITAEECVDAFCGTGAPSSAVPSIFTAMEALSLLALFLERDDRVHRLLRGQMCGYYLM